MTAADVITAISAVIAAISFLWGVSAWKREFVGQRRIELAEMVLAKFYEAADVIRDVRNPHGWGDEGKSVPDTNSIDSGETTVSLQGRAILERWNRHRVLFAELHALKYRCKATFGESAEESFKDLVNVRNRIELAVNNLNDGSQQRTESTPTEILWQRPDNKSDVIAEQVQRSVEKVEKQLQTALSRSSSKFLWRYLASLREYR